MKLVRLSTILSNITSQFSLGLCSSYSTRTKTASQNLGTSRWKGSMHNLYRRISPVGDPKVSIVPLLDQWVQEGRPVDKEQLRIFIKELRSYRRFTHALEISMWMTDKRYLPLTPGDVAIRLDLISKTKGIEQAKNYFNNVPKQLRDISVYTALLNCYVNAKSVEKAEATIQKMRGLGLFRTPLAYNLALKLCYQTENYEKLDSLIREMKEQGIGYDKFTFGIRMSAYAATSNVEGMDKTLAEMESDPSFVLEWTVYTSAASGYAKAGLLDKAFEMLKKCEGLIRGTRSNRAYQFLITQYAKLGKKDEVLRLWENFKKNMKVYNRDYIFVMPSVLKLDDLETAEKIFEDWESQNLHYDFRIANFLIGVYCRKGLLQKAETLISEARLKGGSPCFTTWRYMSEGYLENNQTQKAVEAMKEALLVCRPWWKPRKECLVACLDYFRDEGDIATAEEFIKLLKDKDIISVDLQDRLLKNVRNGKSNLDEISELYDAASSENAGSLSEPEDDISDSIKDEYKDTC